jgi:hypothetical protein
MVSKNILTNHQFKCFIHFFIRYDHQNENLAPPTLPEEIETAIKVKKFVNQNKGINIETIQIALDELKYRFPDLMFGLHDSNIIVLGQNKNGSLRLAIVDI